MQARLARLDRVGFGYVNFIKEFYSGFGAINYSRCDERPHGALGFAPQR